MTRAKMTADELVKEAIAHSMGRSGKKLRTLRFLTDEGGKVLLDEEQSPLRRWGPPLIWTDAITAPCLATDVDFLLHRNGLFLAMEFKHEKEGGGGDLEWAQARTLADLAQTGLAVCYGVRYSRAGNATVPPVVTAICRITDEANIVPLKWRQSTFGGLLTKVNEWMTNANNKENVRRQRAAATFSQFMQYRLWGFASLTFAESRNPEKQLRRARQFEAMRLSARDVREGRVKAEWSSFEEAFTRRLQKLIDRASEERSTA